MTAAPRVGVRTVEVRKSNAGAYWLVALGDVPTVAHSPEEALAVIRRADSHRKAEIAVTVIEWTNTPAGFTPPEAAR